MAVARAQGLPPGPPRVLSSRGNVIVHLAPAPVVARVATLTARTRADPAAWLAREVAVAGYAASRGGPVVAPATLADPGPHQACGLAVSLWELAEPPGPDPPGDPARPAPEQAGRALARLHQAAAGFPGPLPVLAPLHEQITEGLAALERAGSLSAGLLAALRARHAGVLAELGPAARDASAVLHGDAHAGNLLPAAGGGWRWTDLEETCRGPREFDLAVLARHAGAGAGAALAGYAAAAGTTVPGPAALAPFSRARELEGAVWTLCMAVHYPARYQVPAADLLARVLGPGAPGRSA